MIHTQHYNSYVDDSLISPVNQIVSETDTIDIKCDSKVQVLWTFNDNNLPNNTYINAARSPNVLSITQMSSFNHGSYVCKGMDKFDRRFYSQSLITYRSGFYMMLYLSINSSHNPV